MSHKHALHSCFLTWFSHSSQSPDVFLDNNRSSSGTLCLFTRLSSISRASDKMRCFCSPRGNKPRQPDLHFHIFTSLNVSPARRAVTELHITQKCRTNISSLSLILPVYLITSLLCCFFSRACLQVWCTTGPTTPSTTLRAVWRKSGSLEDQTRCGGIPL